MVDSIRAILFFTKDKKRDNLDTDRLLSSGIIREFEILGEAAGRVSLATQKKFPEIPWQQVIGMRNRLIHAYFDVDNDIIWKTIKDYLPKLLKQLEALLTNVDK